MNEILTVDDEKQTVSARELHEKVGSTERFSSWFERQLQFGFEEGQDFTSVKTFTLVNNGAERELQDYELSIDMAKQICMVQKNERAKQIRQYLIDLEKAWNTPEQVMARALRIADKTIASLKDRCKMLGSEIEKKTELIETMQPKVSYYDLILQCAGLLSTTEIAKDYGMSAKAFNNILHGHSIQYKQGDRWFLYSKYENNGYTQSKTHNIPFSDGTQTAKTHMYWTQKGRLFLYEFLKKQGFVPVIEKEVKS